MFNNITFNNCSFCEGNIDDLCLKDINNKYYFCNFACAKLFNDNYEKIIVDFETYSNYYKNKLLSIESRKLFDAAKKYYLFELLPKYNLNNLSLENKLDAKDKYIEMLLT